jgi:hypothetical protein
MREGPGAPDTELSPAMIGAIASETRRLEVMGRDAYINAGVNHDHTIGQMVVMGTILDRYHIQQQHETRILMHAGLTRRKGVKGELVAPPMARPVQSVVAEQVPEGLSEADYREQLACIREKHFLRQGLRWAVQQEAEAIVQLNRIEISSVEAVDDTDTEKQKPSPLTTRHEALAGVGLTPEGDAVTPEVTKQAEADEVAAELIATTAYLQRLRATHFTEHLPDLRPPGFPEHLWEYVDDALKLTVPAKWAAWTAAAVSGRFEEVMEEIKGIDISGENAARKLEEPYLRAQAYANRAVYGHSDPNNQPTTQGYSYDIELNETTPVRSKMRRV